MNSRHSKYKANLFCVTTWHFKTPKQWSKREKQHVSIEYLSIFCMTSKACNPFFKSISLTTSLNWPGWGKTYNIPITSFCTVSHYVTLRRREGEFSRCLPSSPGPRLASSDGPTPPLSSPRVLGCPPLSARASGPSSRTVVWKRSHD